MNVYVIPVWKKEPKNITNVYNAILMEDITSNKINLEKIDIPEKIKNRSLIITGDAN